MRSESMEEEPSCPLTDGRSVTGAKGEAMSVMYTGAGLCGLCVGEGGGTKEKSGKKKGENVSGRNRKFSLSFNLETNPA